MMVMMAVFMVVMMMVMRPSMYVRVSRGMYVSIHFRFWMNVVYVRLMEMYMWCLKTRLFAWFGGEDAVDAKVYEAHCSQATDKTADEHSCYSAFLSSAYQMVCMNC